MTTSSGESATPSTSRSLAESFASRATTVLPLVVGLLAIGPVVWALYAQSFAIFGRDQGIFQYVAWALRHGERAYRDIHEINGPLPHVWYIAMQLAGGEDEHVFRSLDTALVVTAYMFASWTLPTWLGLDLGERARTSRLMRLAWVLAGLAVLGAQYVRYDWWHTTQREGLYTVLVLVSLSLQSIGHTSRSRRRASLAFFFAGITTSLTWFGKPPCAIFGLLQAVVFWLDRANVDLPLRRVAASAFAGALVVFLSMLAFVVAYGDLALCIDILSKVPRLHHTIWNESLVGIYRSYNNAPRLDWGLVTFVGFALVFTWFKLPRRALLVAVLPIGGALVFFGQAKAFPYHLHMLTAGTAIGQLAILAAVAGSLARREDQRRSSMLLMTLIGAAAALGLGIQSVQDAMLSPSVRGHWPSVGATPAQRASREYFNHFPWGDFFPNDLRDAATYLARRTQPDERIQTYGFDPYLLFLARRRSASPVIYSFELNVDAALRGGRGARPSPELRDWLIAYRAEAEGLVLRSVEASPPAAFALLDRAPFTYPEDAEADLATHCPKLHAFMTERYVSAATFGTVRIWLRRDVIARSAE